MLKRSLSTLFIAGTLALQTGCLTIQNSDQAAKRERTIHRTYAAKLKDKDTRYLSVLRANNELSNEVRSLSQTTANNESRLKMIEHKVRQMEQSYASQNSAFAKKLAAERRLREQHSKKLMSQMSNQIADTANKLQDQQKKVISAISQSTASSGEEYVVQSGDTLSVIGKAFGVKISAIKRANNLRSDMIRVGQKLTIPTK